MLAIETARETYYIDNQNNIGRKELIPSGSWKLVGAVEYNNFGNVKARYSVEDIRAGKVVWRHSLNFKYRGCRDTRVQLRYYGE